MSNNSNADVVRAWYQESWTDPPRSNAEAADKYFSDDFRSLDRSGAVAMDKQTFLGMVPIMYRAFPDFTGTVTDIRDDGDDVLMTFHFEGTHRGDLDLSAMGLGVLPPSGERIVWPEAQSRYRLADGRIVEEQQLTSGMDWFLGPLGVGPTA